MGESMIEACTGTLVGTPAYACRNCCLEALWPIA